MGRKLNTLERILFYRFWYKNHSDIGPEIPQEDPPTLKSAQQMISERFGTEALALIDSNPDHPLWDWAKDATDPRLEGFDFDYSGREDELEIGEELRNRSRE